MLEFPAAADEGRSEFLDTLVQLDKQTVQQRVDELLARQQNSALNDAEKAELRELWRSKSQPIPR